LVWPLVLLRLLLLAVPASLSPPISIAAPPAAAPTPAAPTPSAALAAESVSSDDAFGDDEGEANGLVFVVLVVGGLEGCVLEAGRQRRT